MVNSLTVLLNIPVIISILYKMIEILHGKMLNGIYLHWFHNYLSCENDSLNAYSNEPWING